MHKCIISQCRERKSPAIIKIKSIVLVFRLGFRFFVCQFSRLFFLSCFFFTTPPTTNQQLTPLKFSHHQQLRHHQAIKLNETPTFWMAGMQCRLTIFLKWIGLDLDWSGWLAGVNSTCSWKTNDSFPQVTWCFFCYFFACWLYNPSLWEAQAG